MSRGKFNKLSFCVKPSVYIWIHSFCRVIFHFPVKFCIDLGDHIKPISPNRPHDMEAHAVCRAKRKFKKSLRPCNLFIISITELVHQMHRELCLCAFESSVSNLLRPAASGRHRSRQSDRLPRTRQEDRLAALSAVWHGAQCLLHTPGECP